MISKCIKTYLKFVVTVSIIAVPGKVFAASDYDHPAVVYFYVYDIQGRQLSKLKLMNFNESLGRSTYGGEVVGPSPCERIYGSGYSSPSAREFAEFARSRGAKGILDEDQVNPDKIPEGYVKISVSNYDGWLTDTFYYNPSGYKPVDFGGKFVKDSTNGCFWTSSIVDSNFNRAYCFSNSDGHLYPVSRGYLENFRPVMCFKKRKIQ